MELSPSLYHWLVRPQWFSKLYMNRLTSTLLKDFDFQEASVLDFGCGIGTNSWLFNPRSYIGVDCDERRITYAKKKYKKYRFITSKNDSLALGRDSIDFIFIMAVLHHMPGDIILHQLKEFRRVLKDNGKILVIEPCLSPSLPINSWLMKTLDKGKYLRKEESYFELFNRGNFEPFKIKEFKKCLVYNEIFFIAEKNRN